MPRAARWPVRTTPRPIAAAESLGGSGAGNAAEPLAELLAAGAAPARTEASLDALAKLGAAGALTAPRAFDVLDLYTGHHAPEIRQRAVKALGTIKDARVVPTLLARLGDAAPGVRAAAGEALAARHEPTATPAAVRAGQARRRGRRQPAGRARDARPDPADRGAGRQRRRRRGRDDAGRLRTARRRPDRLRLDVVRTIAKLGGAAATTALVEYIASVPAKDDRPSKREAQKLLDEREAAK